MSTETLDERYFNWLYGQVASVKTRARSRSFRCLFRQLHETTFVAVVPHDENRIADAQDLKYEFLDGCEDGQGEPSDIAGPPCSFFELLIILSRQLAFEMDDNPDIWFWHLIEILDLEQYNDLSYDEYAEAAVGQALDRVIWRNYDHGGRGGLFPLRDPDRDQREVELWYQLNAYLLEQF